MSTVALSPHGDDVELFAAQQLVDYRPQVVIVFESAVQELRGTGITQARREAETAAAMEAFGLDWRQWQYPDSQPLPTAGRWRIAALAELYEFCICPAVEEGGHDQHNQVGAAALHGFGPERTIRYLTYRRGEGRSQDLEVELTPETIAKKHLALACHLSQIEEPTTRPWFLDSLREWVSP